jgi:hypothetical protein
MKRSSFQVFSAFALLAAATAFHAGCKNSAAPAPSCTERQCSAGVPIGLPHGLNGKHVDITAAQAWPNRGVEPPSLTPQQQADACALINACATDDKGAALTDDAIATLTQTCANGKSSSDAKEERAILETDQNERFLFEALAVLAGAHDCKSIRAQATKRPSVIVCQEDGCWWESPVPALPACCQPLPTVTCAGDVATLVTEGLTFTRDCSRSYTKCDPKSSTGCTDRAPVACDSSATDYCDGNVKLGCDGDGRVSFHDCGRYPGGHCDQTDPNSVKCVVDDDKSDVSKMGCDAGAPGKLNVCVLGKTVSVDCVALGMAGCAAGHCTPKP